jgi:hypothetical protein
MRTCTGSCHCGRVRFEVELELDHVRVCDCSICHKRGALIHRVEEERMRILTPLEDLTSYEWHTRTAKDYFCPTCGILPFRRPRPPTDEEIAHGARPFSGWSVNARCLDGVDLEDVPRKAVHGSRLD